MNVTATSFDSAASVLEAGPRRRCVNVVVGDRARALRLSPISPKAAKLV